MAGLRKIVEQYGGFKGDEGNAWLIEQVGMSYCQGRRDRTEQWLIF